VKGNEKEDVDSYRMTLMQRGDEDVARFAKGYGSVVRQDENDDYYYYYASYANTFSINGIYTTGVLQFCHLYLFLR
jgi:hypothetical protein